MKIKLLHHKGTLLYSKDWPEVPPVMVSANADTLAYANFKRKVELAKRYAIRVLNKEEVIATVPAELDGKHETYLDFEVDSVRFGSDEEGHYMIIKL